MGISKIKQEKPFSEMSLRERAAFYAESPYMKKKKEQAIAFLEKHPIPEDLFKK
ncbi:hypothetical protein D3C87_1333360 [compost metagenome]